jgi:hypothetical protein
MHWVVSIFSLTHTAGMHAYTEKLCEIYPKFHRDSLKNPNKSQKNKSRYLLLKTPFLNGRNRGGGSLGIFRLNRYLIYLHISIDSLFWMVGLGSLWGSLDLFITIWEKSALIVPFAKRIDKNQSNDRKKLYVVFDRAMSNVYENNIFSTLPYDMVEIHNITS